MAYLYGRDEDAIREWVEMSKTVEGTQAYLQKYVYDLENHEAYLRLVGGAAPGALRGTARKEAGVNQPP
ncbi:MAG: hypothetical protein Fur0016_08580 [Anaerolineales bacterium]